jgi:hypothetical protein
MTMSLGQGSRQPGGRVRRRLLQATLSLVAGLAMVCLLPFTSLAGKLTLSDVINKVETAAPQLKPVLQPVARAVPSSSSSATHSTSSTTSAAKPAASASSPTTSDAPATYGTNPHGQGTVAGIQLPLTNPQSNYPYDPGGKGAGEILVLGRGRSYQNSDGSYHAHTTIAALLGTELLGVNANPGQSNTGPLNSVQTAILDQLCKSSGQNVCLTVLAADTVATASGSHTHFAVLDASVLNGGGHGLTANVADSNSSIATSGGCQNASGDSTVANSTVGGGPLVGLAHSSEASSACSNGTHSQTASSRVLNVGNSPIGFPAAGCANGTPNTKGGLPPLLSLICNPDKSDPIGVPSGVRQALAVVLIDLPTSGLLKAVTAASESHAVAPAASISGCTDSDHDCGNGPPLTSSCIGFPNDTVDNDGDCDAGNKGTTGGKHKGGQKCTDADHDCGIGPSGTPEVCVGGSDPDGDGDCTSAGSVAGAATTREVALATAKGTLPFTGQDVLEVILVGLLLTAGGLALSSRIRRTS